MKCMDRVEQHHDMMMTMFRNTAIYVKERSRSMGGDPPLQQIQVEPSDGDDALDASPIESDSIEMSSGLSSADTLVAATTDRASSSDGDLEDDQDSVANQAM